jgi:hypothetical protein
MKFKHVKGAQYKYLSIKGEDGDKLDVETREDGKPGLFVFLNDNDGFELKRTKALELAWAIIDELNPSQLA